MTTTPYTITDESYDRLISNAPVPVVLDFWAEWCPPCKHITPWMERLAANHGEALRVGLINADDCPDIIGRHAVSGLPTILLLKDGKVVHRQVDALNEQQLNDLVHEHLLGD